MDTVSECVYLEKDLLAPSTALHPETSSADIQVERRGKPAALQGGGAHKEGENTYIFKTQ